MTSLDHIAKRKNIIGVFLQTLKYNIDEFINLSNISPKWLNPTNLIFVRIILQPIFGTNRTQ